MGEPAEAVLNLIHEIKLGKLSASYEITVKSIALFKEIIQGSDWKTAEDLMVSIRQQARIFQSALPQESVTANVARRILRIIRDEYHSGNTATVQHQYDDSQGSLSLHKLVTQTSEHDSIRDYSKPQQGLKSALLDHLQEIEVELETSTDNLSAQAPEHIHSQELILTLGHSRTVDLFLKNAAKERKFEVVVAECAPSCRGHQLATSLAKAKIETTVIPDSAIFAMMSRVNKVIIGTHAVLANGGLRAAAGAYTIALAAKHYSVPVIVLVPMFKLSPVHLCSYEQDAFNLVGNSEGVIPYNSTAARFSKAYSPVFDYVPPELVTLFISNAGGNAPSYVYRLLSELYHPDDYIL
ncbi:translation initiation factor eIF2B subunit beta [Culicoides brevitarsis]|uniref:translation initiation factor eIF2B subunit beta n=1 Tax=Culicoides brevitarsis TaxID=469753 RepID=UPI00307BF223